MFREMRRKRQALALEDIERVLEHNTNGVVSVHGDDGYPYGVPVNYVYFDKKVYFHSAKNGHKVEALANDGHVCFTVVDEDMIVGKEYTSYFRSVIAFGVTRIVEGDERTAAFRAMVEKYSGDQPESEREEKIGRCERSYVVAIDIEHMTGKEALEQVRLASSGRMAEDGAGR
jgi:nitroimidazol reductase NimA-like FMN-containing flavoprotein (pyridoxamine 5'-phosphate oxidase superfamily)